MANRIKGWNKWNHLKQIEANKSRGKVEKVVSQEGDFLYFMLQPAKRLQKGWNLKNAHKVERKKVEMQLKHEEMARRQKRHIGKTYGRGNGKTRLVRKEMAK